MKIRPDAAADFWWQPCADQKVCNDEEDEEDECEEADGPGEAEAREEVLEG